MCAILKEARLVVIRPLPIERLLANLGYSTSQHAPGELRAFDSVIFCSDQFPSQHRHRLANQDHVRARDSHLDHSAATGNLMGDEGRSIELLCPVGTQAAMCGAADRVFVDAHQWGEETGHEVIISRAGTAGDDHAPDRELLEPADIRA